MRRLWHILLLGLLASPVRSQDVLSDLISPGLLSSAHVSLEGSSNCTTCHKLAAGVPNEQCLTCHAPIAQRQAQRRGLHGQLGPERRCIECHTEHKGRHFDIRAFDPKTFDHATIGWPLRGEHAEAACKDCHGPTRSYLGAAQKCDSCHQDPHRGQFAAQTCEQCHGTEAKTFKIPDFNHDKTRFPLVGEHVKQPCQSCHVKGQFKPLDFADCASCHKDPHVGQFKGQTCNQCHAAEAQTFKIPDFNHDKTRFPLVGEHVKQPCQSCHVKGQFKPLDFADCASCHKDPHKGQFSDKTCASCHATPQGWKSAGSAVEHDKTRFPLRGAHAAVRCESCHKGGRFKLESLECKSCHEDKHRGQFPNQDCAACHTVVSFKPAVFEHSRARFALTGKHTQLACQQCHAKGRYKPLPFAACTDCHKDPHKGQFKGRECSSCHTTQSWKTTAGAIDHEQTRFPLRGAHEEVRCESCHQQGRFKLESVECKSCHQDPHRGQFPKQDCSSCHTQKSFVPSSFEHVKAAFQLAGKHRELKCFQCHESGRYKPIAHQRCADCHRQDPHEGQFEGKDCESCHKPEGWKQTSFDHAKDSRFALLGKHRAVPCADCHKTGRYKPLATECSACHKNVHKDPLKAVCEDCHTQGGWNQTRFPHDLPTFRLVGQHATLRCEECHKDGTEPPVKPLSPECASCHRDEHAGQLGQRCQDCHQPISWTLASFQHMEIGNRLSGVHATLACRDCHQDNRFRGQSTECMSCHRQDFLETESPNHQQSGFTQCEGCHTQAAWTPASINHDQFPLQGGHAGLRCEDCHEGGRFEGTSPLCRSCHQSDYNATVNPNHAQSGYSTSCESCHSTAAWRPANVNHDQFFRLDGAHRAARCEDCHRNGQFQGTPRQCVGCHQADYNATTNPNHAQTGFPQSCQDCHSTSAWRPASFNHASFFPVPHQGVSECRDCHTTGSTQQFSCIDCHEHNRSEMDDEHGDVGGYQYNSQSCFNCHPRGTEDD